MVKSDKNTLTPKQVGNKLMLLLNEVSKKHPNSLWHWDSLVLCWDMICFVYENSIPLFSDIFLQLIRSFEAEMTEVLFFRVQNNKELTEEMRSFTKFDPENPKSDLNKSRDLKKYDTDEIKWGIPYYNWISLSKQAKVELLQAWQERIEVYLIMYGIIISSWNFQKVIRWKWEDTRRNLGVVIGVNNLL